MKLIVQLVTWNGAKYIPFLFDSLKQQTFEQWELAILDNASTDGTADAIKNALHDFSRTYYFDTSKENLGFTGGHNLLFTKHESAYVLLLNQDMILEPDCFEKLVAHLDTHGDVAAVAPRLMRWDFERNQKTDDIDALGLQIFRNRRVVEQYTRQSWSQLRERFSQPVLPVFGVSGAFPLYRRSALQHVAFEDGEFLDGSYGSYKEDVDLALRLQSVGFSANVLLDVVAYHDRSGAGPKELADTNAAKNKKDQSSWVKYHSYKNHLMTLFKNEYWQNLLLDFPWIFWYELKKFGWFLLFDRSVLKGFKDIWMNRQKLREKRRLIHSNRNQRFRALRQFWRGK